MEIIFLLILLYFVYVVMRKIPAAGLQSGAVTGEQGGAAETAQKPDSMAALYRNQSSRPRQAEFDAGARPARGSPKAEDQKDRQNYYVGNAARAAAMKRRREEAAKALEREAAEEAIARRQDTDYRSGSTAQKPLAQDMNRQRRRGLYSGRHRAKLSGQLAFIIVVLTLFTLMSISRI